MQKSSIELMLSSRAIDVWSIVVGSVGTGGFVTPCVPVAITPPGKEAHTPAMWPAKAKAQKNIMSVEERLILSS
jgi:hypothetical protein